MILTTFTLALALTVHPERSAAESKGQAIHAARPGAITQSKEGGKKKKKVIRLDALTVEGRIQKPQAFYILQRSNLNFEELNSTESFMPKVEKSVENDPF